MLNSAEGIGPQIKEEDKAFLNKFYSKQAIIYDPLKAGSIDGTDSVPHDKAVSRALSANYRPPSTSNNPEKTIIVGRLNINTTEQALLKVFCVFGRIKSCKLVRCIVTGISKRYAFIEYEERVGANKAYWEGNKMNLDDAILLVDFECEHLLPNWVPRRLGGGLGGKKESGQLRFGSRDRPFRKPIPLIGTGDEKSSHNYSGPSSQRDRDRGKSSFRYHKKSYDDNGKSSKKDYNKSYNDHRSYSRDDNRRSYSSFGKHSHRNIDTPQ